MQNDKRKVIVYFVRRWGIVLLLAVTLYCCKNESGTPGKVVIVSTNDMHAQLARFPLLATLIQQKKTEGGEVIVVDAGDRFSGNPYVDHALERGEPMILLMNKVGYDVVTMGNHDFDYGQKILKKRLHEANFPVVCANMLSEKSELGQLPAYQMIERGGLKFCFFSLTIRLLRYSDVRFLLPLLFPVNPVRKYRSSWQAYRNRGYPGISLPVPLPTHHDKTSGKGSA